MRAWRIYGEGDMRLDVVPDPVPPPGWVTVRVCVVQPSITETLLFQGVKTYLHATVAAAIARGPAPLFGHEFSGVVSCLGAGVDCLAVGDRVAARGSHPEGIVGFDYPGALAEQIVVPASLLARLPATVTHSEGAVVQALTDAVAAVDAAGPLAGRSVAVIGQGAMGLSCLQVARAAGAQTLIAIAKREASLVLARRFGAHLTVNATTEDVVAAVRAATHGRGVDVVFETAGGPVEQGLAGDATLAQAAALVRDAGTVVGVAFHGDGTFLPYGLFRFRGIRYLFPSLMDRALFENTVALLGSGAVDVKPMVTHVLQGLEQIPQAFALTADKARHGLINPAQVVVSQD